MMKNNNWKLFGRCLFVVLICIAAFCGICGLGATFNQIPWFRIAIDICIAMVGLAVLLFVGFKIGTEDAETKKPHPARASEKRMPYDQDAHKKPDVKKPYDQDTP